MLGDGYILPLLPLQTHLTHVVGEGVRIHTLAEFHHEPHLVGGLGIEQGLFIADLALGIQFIDGLIEGAHTQIRGALHQVLQQMGVAAADDIRG